MANEAIWISSAILLSLFGIGYTGLIVAMLLFARLGHENEPPTSTANTSDTSIVVAIGDGNSFNFKAKGQNLFRGLLSWLNHNVPTDIRDHYYTAALDLPKLIFQTTTLITYLSHGFPTPIVYSYSVLLLCNWFAACYRSQRYVADPNLIIARLYYTYDLFFAVFAPLVVLLYFIQSFQFNRAEFATKMETIQGGSYDTIARLFGNPAEISSFCNAFHYLQFSSGDSLFYKSALNLLSLYKWRKIIMTLIHNQRERRLERERKAQVQPLREDNKSRTRTQSLRVTVEQKLYATARKPTFGKQFIPKFLLSLIFFVAGSAIFVYSIGSVRSSQQVCSKFDKCAVASYRWNFGVEHCPCLVFADRQTAPRTYAEWTDPEDTSAKLAELAYAGELRIVQIINRAVPELPEELRKCHHLEQLILVYTKTLQLPEWMSEFSDLEYFHLEGDYTARRLQLVPAGTFDHMPHLTFIHFGGIPDVEELPSFSSLGKLRYLTLAILNSLKELPSFEGLSTLIALNIVEATRAKTLPSLAPLVSLKSLGLRYRTGVCCNGYITGTCDTTSFQCAPRVGEKYPMTCITERVSDADKAIISMYDETEICPNSFAYDLESAAPTKYTSDDLCGSVLYKNCSLNGVQGICYNTRMMVISCVTQPAYITMRKLQIERKSKLGLAVLRLALHDAEEDERVVYYDLEAGAHSRNRLVPPNAASAHAQTRPAVTKVSGTASSEGGSYIFPRKQQTLFHLGKFSGNYSHLVRLLVSLTTFVGVDDSGDEAEDENPFATLLQQQQTQQTVEPVPERNEGATQQSTEIRIERPVPDVEQRNGGLANTNGNGGNRRSILKDSQQLSTGISRVRAGGKKKLGFEAAGSRPERWSTRKTSATDTKNRRKSLGAIRKRRSQLEASAAKRRKSMPPISLGSQVDRNQSSTDDNMIFAGPKGRLLSDVLQQATTLSQQRNESSVSPRHIENSIESDAIIDTEPQMRAEPFAPQIFSPSKPAPASGAINRMPRDDATVSKVRGKVGDLIRKAIRKRNRDLTLLRSHGQHLLPQQGSHSSPKGIVGAVESIQDRPYVVVVLHRRNQVTPHTVSYDCQICEVTAKLEGSLPSVLRGTHSEVMEAIFRPKTAEYLKLSSGLMLKIYEPLHFVSEKMATGSTCKPSDTVTAVTSNQAKISKMAQSSPSQRLLRSHKYPVNEEEDESEDSVDIEERGFTTHDEEDMEERAPLAQAQIDKLEAIASRWGTSWTSVAMGRSSVSTEKANALLKLRDAFLKITFPCKQQTLFHLGRFSGNYSHLVRLLVSLTTFVGVDDSGDEAEDENPFATLLQQQQTQQTVEPVPERNEGATQQSTEIRIERPVPDVEQRNGGLANTNGNGGNRRSILKDSQQLSTGISRVRAGGKKKLGFEAAGSRPERWSTRKTSATDTKNRRKSLGAIRKRRSQLEASAAKRRKSMPPISLGSQVDRNQSSTDDNMIFAGPKGRLLSDVLQQATTLSQQRNESSVSPRHIENSIESDAIIDTEPQMRAEPFAPQIFSPSKPAPASGAINRMPRDDATVSKVRGKVGDLIRKAIRKRNRDLTLLRSHGQHLLPQQGSHSSPKGIVGAVESIQDRPYVVVVLHRRNQVTPHTVSYDCQICEVTAKLEGSLPSVLRGTHSEVMEAIFRPKTAEYLKLSSGLMLKIYEPLHFVSEKMATGSTCKPRWFLLSTQLAEVAKISKMAQSSPSQRLLRSHKYPVNEEEDESEDSVDIEERGFTTHDEEDMEERAPLAQAQIDKLEAIASRWGTSWTSVAMGRSSVSTEKANALLKLRDAFLKITFPCKQQTLFHLGRFSGNYSHLVRLLVSLTTFVGVDDSGDEAEDENPFATLLQQQQTQQTVEPVPERNEGATQQSTEIRIERPVPDVEQRNGGLANTNGNGGNRRSILKDSQQLSTGISRVRAGGKKKLGFEAAGSRPERWSTRKTSATDTKNRRKSLGAIRKRRSQLEASAAKRRKSMPPISLGSQVDRNQSSTDDNMVFAGPKGRLLSDVLQQATTLSQQRNESSVSPRHIENSIESDAIIDTEPQMRAEPFAPQIFSPSKPAPASGAINRMPRDDATVSKVRGKVGDLIRKAIRKRNRDLTLLRSHGQHLLPQQGSHSSPKGIVGAVESIQDRPYVVVVLHRRNQVTPHTVSYDCQICEVTAKLEGSLPSVLRGTHSEVMEAIFRPKTAEYLKLSSGLMLKIYEPLHFVSEKMATGSTCKPRWFLLSTQLAEVAKISKMAQSSPSQRLLRSHKYPVNEEEDESEDSVDSVDIEERGFTTHDEEDMEERAPLAQAQIDKLEAIASRWGTSWTSVAMGRSSVSTEKANALLKLRDAFLKITFPCKQQTLFHLGRFSGNYSHLVRLLVSLTTFVGVDDSGDEAEDENPFATLLQQQQTQQTVEPVPERNEGATQQSTEIRIERPVPDVEQRNGGLANTNGNGGNRRSILKDSQQLSTGISRVRAGGKKKLGFEAAGSRPERWSTRKTSATDTKNRRKSLGAIRKRRSQLEASAAKRRKSMPPISLGSQVDRNQSSTDDNMIFAGPKGRLLSDVLQQATTLSQQRNESSVSPRHIENSIESDAIIDTEPQMRAEPFAPQIFSPSKPAPASGAINRMPRDDATVSKVRGKVGDLIRKAIRKRNRDLTLLRSHGQHLLPQQGSHSSPKGIVGAVESIQDRPYVVVVLHRRNQVTPHTVSYDCQICEVTAKLEGSLPSVLRGTHSEVMEAIFRPKTAEYLKLSSGLMLKIYEPLHFVSEKMATGSTCKPRWFLLSTQLAEVVQGNLRG
ncbi:hypothetical protein P3T76_012381 [Phytophthora citrophthora]|uniref:WLGC domain-containing protein n=1 Tax=Phytophthora citrophthora TaxID=4793 RepID=A0AAD9G5U7_9STRA|nr:hypothetical protein P3T76_012381 [Phytophthora citrophthora]